jgi:glycerol-3-phosphate acyltransferase PlsY
MLGSIPSAVWIGKSVYNTDVRKFGSGNAGTTNVLRILGAKAAIPVFAIDIVKGFLAVQLAWMLMLFPLPNMDVFSYREAVQIMYGVLAVVGHMYPVFADFRGGKGVATMLGVIIAIHPVAALGALAVFLVVYAISKYVSLGSICAGIAFPILVMLVLPLTFPQEQTIYATHEAWPTNKEMVEQLVQPKPEITTDEAHVEVKKAATKGNLKRLLKLDADPTLTMQVFSICVCLLLLYTHRGNMKRLSQGKEAKTRLRKPAMVGAIAKAQASARKRAQKANTTS